MQTLLNRLSLLILSSAAALAYAAETPRTTTVAIGPEYVASGFHQLWFGTGYRPLWTTPVTLEVLDLARFAGGLTPIRQVGQMQTPGLALAGADGRAYTFRSLQKEPERTLPPEWRDAWPARIVRDHTSATHPGAALLLPPLAAAAGVLHTEPRLVVMPDDPALGAFRPAFANRVGTIDEFPRAAADTPSFHGATEIITTRQLWERWKEGPQNRVDTRAYLRARVLDLYIENYDRHKGQWRWARLPGEDLWQPLPEDPDMAFIRNEGLAIGAARSRAPRFVRFRPSFDSRLEGPTSYGSEVDRWVLTDLDRDAFAGVVHEVRDRFTDEVIAASAARLPAEWRAIGEKDFVAALQARRERLVAYLMHFYRDLAREVDIHATDRDEVISVRRLDDDAVEVSVALPGATAPYYLRRFVPSETREVRLYLHGGNDRVERGGRPGGPIRVRVIAGEGHDVVDDSASGGSDVWAGAGELELRRGRGTRHHAAWTNPRPVADAPWLEPRNWGRWTVTATQLTFADELDFVFGFGVTRSHWGFRAVPEAKQEELAIAWSSGERRGRVSYRGTFRPPGSRLALRVDAIGSGIERINFFGLGNETPRPEARSRYRTLESFVAAAPSLRLAAAKDLELHLGATIRASDTPSDRPNILNATEAYGRGRFAETGLRAGVQLDSRMRGPRGSVFAPPLERRAADVRLELDGFFYPALLDVTRSFGGVEGEIAGYLGQARSRVQLAARVGGRRVCGEFPWLESAFLGGRATLRGYSRNRFAGDRSLYGGAELRAWLFSADLPPVPLRVGVLGFADVGRVWYRETPSERWHDSWGGGLMLQPLATPFVASATVARSREQTRWYVGSGFSF